MKGYKWDFEEIKKKEGGSPSEKDINRIYKSFLSGYTLRDSIKHLLKNNLINKGFTLRQYTYRVNQMSKYKNLIKEKKEIYKSNCIKVLELHNDFMITEIALITGFDYKYIFDIINK